MVWAWSEEVYESNEELGAVEHLEKVLGVKEGEEGYIKALKELDQDSFDFGVFKDPMSVVAIIGKVALNGVELTTRFSRKFEEAFKKSYEEEAERYNNPSKRREVLEDFYKRVNSSTSNCIFDCN